VFPYAEIYAEVPGQKGHISLLSIYGYRLAIAYFGVVTGGGRQLTEFYW